MRGQDTLPLHGEHRSAMNRTNRVSGENNSTFIPTNEEVEKKQPEAKSSKNLGHSLWIKAVFTGVSGKFLTLQQISAYVKTCGWHLTLCCNTVTIVIGHEQ